MTTNQITPIATAYDAATAERICGYHPDSYYAKQGNVFYIYTATQAPQKKAKQPLAKRKKSTAKNDNPFFMILAFLMILLFFYIIFLS